MRSIILSTLLLVSSVAAVAQQPNTVSTTVFTTQPVPAGNATFQVQFLEANLNSSVDTAIGVLGGAGASAANLAGISVSLSQGFPITQYDFVIVTPASNYSATRDKLLAAQKAIANVTSQAIGWTSAYNATEDDALTILQQSLPLLMDKAKQQATVLAKAMGANLGKVSTISTPALVRSGLSMTVSATVTYLVETPAP